MLTGLVEKGYSKCELYFPIGEENKCKKFQPCSSVIKKIVSFSTNQEPTDCSEDEHMIGIEKDLIDFGSYSVRYICKEELGECVVRTLQLNKNVINIDANIEGSKGLTQFVKTESRQLYHYWYQNWADHKLANPEQVLKIALRVLNLDKDSKNSSTERTYIDLLEIQPRTNVNINLKLDHKISSDSGSIAMTEHSNSILKLDDNVGKKIKLHLKTLRRELGGIEMSNCTSTHDSNTIEALNLPDDKVLSFDIDSERTINKFTFDQELLMKKEEVINSPITVHCSAGIGRTGCFLAILNGIQQLKLSYNVDILAIVCSLRLNRGGMVQTAEQYELIHRVLSLYAEILSY